MLDHPLPPSLSLGNIEIHDHVALGQIIADWAVGLRPLPSTVSALRQQLDGVAEISPRVREIAFERPEAERLVIRLPDAIQVEEATDSLADPWVSGDLPLPRFYAEVIDPGSGPVLSPLEIMHARIADTALAHSPWSRAAASNY